MADPPYMFDQFKFHWDEKCPHYRTRDRLGPKCRLTETFEDGSKFVGISFGDFKWIDTSLPCQCSPPRPWGSSVFWVEPTFAFEIFKSPIDFKIIVNSEPLQRELQEAYKSNLELLCDTTTEPSKLFNGLVLLKHRASLVNFLESTPPVYPWLDHHDTGLSLLVNGVLSDGELFASLGHSQLLEQGWLAPDLWRTFQLSRVQRQILALEQLPDIPDEEAMHLPTVDASGHLCSGMDGSVTPEADISATSEPPMSFYGTNLPSCPWQSHDYSDTETATSGQTGSGLGSAEEEIKDLLHLGAFYRSLLPTKHETPHGSHTPLSIEGLDLQDLLLYAVLDGDTRAVDGVFRMAIITRDSKTKPTRRHVDLDWVDGNRTLLLAAVAGGNQNLVKLLLDKGADVEVGTETETALCVAARMQDETMVRLLLDRGADYGTAELLLRMPSQKMLSLHTLNRLRAYVARYKRDELAGKRAKAMQLRVQFWREHQHIKRTAQWITSPSRLSWRNPGVLCTRWGRGIELDSRSAWSTSLRVLRGLCRGVLPRSLNDTLLFLALAKNMSSIIHSEVDKGVASFRHDLARWQLLFDRSDVSQDQFHQAVKNIWGVDVTRLWHFDTVPSALESFQNLVFEFSNLMADSENYQGNSGTGHTGLLSVQASWRDGLPQTSAPASESDESHCTDQPHYTDPSQYSCCETTGPNSFPATKAEDPIFPMPEKDKHTLPSRDRLVLVILMAGAIFAAVFAFLLVMSASPYSIPRGANGANHDKCFEVRYNLGSTDSVYQDSTGTLRTSLENLVSFSCHHLSTTSGIERSRSLLLALLGFRAYGSSATERHEGERIQKSSQSPGMLIGQHKRAASSADLDEHVQQQQQQQQQLEPDGQVFESQAVPSQPAKRQKIFKKTFCDECNRDYHTTSNYGKHRAGPLHDNVRHYCSFECGKSFLRKDERAKHEKKAHEFLLPQLPLPR